MAVIDRVLIGEALVIENRPDGSGLDLKNVAHIDLIMGPRGSAAEDAFCRTPVSYTHLDVYKRQMHKLKIPSEGETESFLFLILSPNNTQFPGDTKFLSLIFSSNDKLY